MNASAVTALFEIDQKIHTYKNVMYMNGVVALLTNSLAIYMILWRSPAQMQNYRWYLFNIIIWSGTLDIYVCLLYQPFLLFPAISVCAQGILANFTHRYMHILFFLHNWLMGGLGMSITTAFMYRYFAVVHSIDFMHRRLTITLIVLFHIFYSSPIAVMSLYASLQDPERLEEDMKENFPLIYEFSRNKGCMITSTKLTPMATVGFLSTAICTFVLSGALITSLIYVIMYKIKQEKFAMSSRTYAMEKQLLASLAIQFFVPSMFIALPFLLQINMIIFGKVDDGTGMQLGAMFFIFATWHSSLNAICMIALTKPYRSAFIDLTVNLLCCGQTPNRVIFANENVTLNAITGRTSSYWLRRNAAVRQSRN